MACVCWYSQQTRSWQRRYPNKEISPSRCYWLMTSGVTSNVKSLRKAGRYGSVSVHDFDGSTLPYTDNLVNLVVVDTFSTLHDTGLEVRGSVAHCCASGYSLVRLLGHV